MTPRWKIRREPEYLPYPNPVWVVYDEGWPVAFYRLWENAIAHTEIR